MSILRNPFPFNYIAIPEAVKNLSRKLKITSSLRSLECSQQKGFGFLLADTSEYDLPWEKDVTGNGWEFCVFGINQWARESTRN